MPTPSAARCSPLPTSAHRCPPAARCRQGLAHCYAKNDSGKLADQYIIEPITANSLECMANGVPPAPAACARRARLVLLHAPATPATPERWCARRPACLGRPPGAGAKTSFMHVFSLRLGEALARDKSAFPPEFAEVRCGERR